MKMNDARTLSAEAQEDLRKRVVWAVAEERMAKAEAVRTFQVSKTAVHNWVKGYEADGEAALRARPRPPAAKPADRPGRRPRWCADPRRCPTSSSCPSPCGRGPQSGNCWSGGSG